MSNAPTGDATTGTGSTLVSMFQTNGVALKAVITFGAAKARANAVAGLQGIDWAQGPAS